MIVPTDADTAARLRSERNQGRAVDMGWLDHDRLGFNYRLSDVASAIGVAQVEKLPSILERRAAVAAAYAERLAGVPGVDGAAGRPRPELRSWFVYVVRLADAVDRDAVMAALRERGIDSKVLPAERPPLPAPARARLPRGPVPGRRGGLRPLAWRCPSSPRWARRRSSASAPSWPRRRRLPTRPDRDKG